MKNTCSTTAKRRLIPTLTLLTLLLALASPIITVSAATNIKATLVLSASDYPNVSDWIQPLPTLYVNWQGRNHILQIIWDRVRDYDLSNEVYNDYTFSTLNVAPTNEYKCILRTMWWNVSNEYVYLRFYHGNDTTHLGVYDLTYNIETRAVSVSFVKYLSTVLNIVATTVKYSHYLSGYIYYCTNNATGNYIGVINVNSGASTFHATGLGEYFAEPTAKYFTVKGYEYMFLGRHLAGDPHRYIDINNFTKWTLTSQGGGSPRSNIGAPFKTSDMVYTMWPLTGGGVDLGGVNKVLWYATNTTMLPTKVAETILGTIADFPHAGSNVDPWALYVVCRLANGKFFAIANINPDNYATWFILNSDWSVYEKGTFSHVPTPSSFMYNAMPEYCDKTNYPVVDQTNKLIWILQRVKFGSTYKIQLWKIDFSALSVAKYNEYGYVVANRGAIPPTAITPQLNLLALPTQLGALLGVGSLGGGLILSCLILLSAMIPVATSKTGIITPVIVGITFLGLFTFLGWIPFWIILLVALLVAGLWASGISKAFQG